MNIRQVILRSFMLAAGALSGYAGAAPYGDIQLCDGVKLAEDKAGNWGCWNNLEPTAAGPGGGAFMALPSGDAFRQNPAFTEQACPSGAVCGHALYWNIDAQTGAPSGPYPAQTVAFVGSGPGQAASMQLVPLNPADPVPQFVVSGLLAGLVRAGNNQQFNLPPFRVIFVAQDGSSPLISGPFVVYDYVNGSSDLGLLAGSYVGGAQYPSPATLAALAVNNVSASYSGIEFFTNQPVNINVNFGQAAWNGTWGNGSPTAWNAAGTVTGANIQSSSIGGYYNGGQVQGSFYGGNAEALAGVVDVHKLVNNAVTERHVDLFKTTTTGVLNNAP